MCIYKRIWYSIFIYTYTDRWAERNLDFFFFKLKRDLANKLEVTVKALWSFGFVADRILKPLSPLVKAKNCQGIW